MSIVDQTKNLVEELSEAGQSLAHSAVDMVSNAAEAVSESVSSLSERISNAIDDMATDDAPASAAAEIAGNDESELDSEEETDQQ